VYGRRLLLVIDNCEHVVQASAEVVERLLSASSQLRVLATSREALRVPGEFAWRVPSLPVPEIGKRVDARQLMEYAATKLLIDRIHQAEPEFPMSGTNAMAAVQVCSRLDGIPLAIELAAARAGSMSLDDIALRLDDRFKLLTGGTRTAVERQRTLRATIDWSHALLSPTDRTLFRRLAIFAGGWTLDAAESVCADGGLPSSEILDVLTRLIDQSLVSVQVKDGRTRYRFLETVRAYAAEQLRASGEAPGVQARHRDWCVAFAERANQGLTGPDQFAWFEHVTSEHDNVRAALDSCTSEPNVLGDAELRIVAAMGQFWWPRKPGEGRRRLADALARGLTAPSAARTTALIWQALFERNFGDPAIGRNIVRVALADAQTLGDGERTVRALYAFAELTNEDDQAGRLAALEEGLAVARAADLDVRVTHQLALLGAVAIESGDFQRAGTLLNEGDRLARRSNDMGSQRTIDAQFGWLAIAEGRLEEAESRFHKASAPSNWGSAPAPVVLLALGNVYLLQGDLEQARTVYRRALRRVQEAEPGGMTMADALLDMACAEEAAGFHERAQRLIGASERWYSARGEAGRVWRPFTRNPLKRGLVPIPPMPHDQALVHARMAGRAMTLEDAVEFGLDEAD
jgi:non-specific serine/threonine protein kinase